MAKNQELELSILIGGHVDNSLAQAVKSANAQIGSIANGASKFAADIAKGAIAAAGGVAAGVVNTTKEAVSFESEMLDVTKYVSGLTDDSGKVVQENYAQMSKDILDLSTEIPYTAQEITRLAAAAGQSGKSMDDLISEGFLRDVAEMGTAMDISADQAGDWAAKWEVAFNTNHEGVMTLADQINYLGAHYATTAAEIAQTVNDTGSLGLIAGMDTSQTAALSTALLAMGVDSGKVSTSIRRMYTNLTMGSKATKDQKEAFEELGFSATQFAKDMQKVDANGKSLAPEALKKLFTAIGQQDKDKQVGYLKTLLGQWAIESGAKLTGNLDLFIKTLDDVGDASKYNGSMYKEFLLKCETSESVLTMMSNAWRAVRIEIGNNFLPILKEVAGVGIDKLNDFRAALPDITAKVKEVIEYLLKNGDKVVASIGGIGAAWAGLRFAPQILQVVKTFSGNGSNSNGLMGMLTPTRIFQNTVSGVKSGASNLWNAGKAAVFGAGLANSSMTSTKGGFNVVNGNVTPTDDSLNTFSGIRGMWAKAQNGIIGAAIGLKNSKKLTTDTGKSGSFWKNVLGTANEITTAKESGGLLGMLKNTAVGKYATGIGDAAKGFVTNGKSVLSNLTKTGLIQDTIDVGKWAGAKAGAFLSGTGAKIGSVLSGIGATAPAVAQPMLNSPFANALGGIGSRIKGFAGNVAGNVAGAAGTAWMGAKELAGNAIQSKTGQAIIGGTKNVLQFAGTATKGLGTMVGSGLNVAGTVLSPLGSVAGKLGSGFMSLLGTFGPVITGIGSIIAIVSLLGDHFTDIQYIVYELFGNKGLELFNQFAIKVKDIGGTIKDSITNAFSLENLQNIQQSLSGKSVLGIDDLGATFGAVIPIIESVKGLIGQIVDLGVNHIKPLLADVMDFAVNELFPAVTPLISAIISLVGTTLINAIKVVVDVIHQLLPVIEPVIQGIVTLIKGIVSVTISVVNTIIRALNKFSVTVPDWVPEIGGKKFGFDLKEVAVPAFANGGFTNGVSIVGEAGTEAVISFKPSVHDSNVENWVRAGRMLGVSGEDATRAAGVQNIQYFANGGFTDGSREKLDNLIDFSKAYGDYALRSNGINSTGDALSMIWTVANNSMSGDGSLALVATSIAADVAPLVLNKYLGSDSKITTMLTEAAKTYNGGTVLSSWDKDTGVLTDTGTPLYMLPQRDTEKTLPDLPSAAYSSTGGNSESSGGIKDSQFVFAPQITVGSNAQAAEIEQMMREMFEQFKREMREEEREQGRVKYAS